MSNIFNFPPDLYDAVIIGNACPIDPSVIFAVNSTTKGALLPCLTDSQMNAIVAPAIGLIIYNLTQESYFYYNGTVWQSFATTTQLAGQNQLSELLDVQLTSPATADILKFNGSKWINAVDFNSFGYTNVTSVSSSYLAILTDVIILCNGLLTVTLPSAVGIKDKTYHIKNVGAQTVTINTSAGIKIDGNDGILITRQYDSYMIVSDNLNWYII